MSEVTKGYEDFIKKQKAKDKKYKSFEKALEKVAKPKQRGSK